MRRSPHQSKSHSAARRALLGGAVCAGVSLSAVSLAPGEDGPNSSLYSGKLHEIKQIIPGPSGGMGGGFAMGAAGQAPPMSWYEIPIPPAKEVKINDIITIRVDTGARMSESAQLQRRRTAQYDAKLSDWIVLEGLTAIKPAPQSSGDERVQGNLNQLNRVTAQLDTVESMKFEIAATVAAVLPNGNIVLEAHREINDNNEKWMHSLSGVCRREDIGPNNIVLSKDIANLRLDKRELGQIRDAYKRGWLARWWDQIQPF
jgi:flagellar L-ring protein precursor FlgH